MAAAVSGQNWNTPPAAKNDTVVVLPGESILIDGTANDSDVDGQLLEVRATSQVEGTLVDMGDGSFVYTAPNDFDGTFFNYRLWDGIAESNVARVDILKPGPGPPDPPGPHEPAAVTLFVSFVPGFGEDRVSLSTTTSNPIPFEFYYDPNLGGHHERPGTACSVGPENPTYVKVRLEKSSHNVDGCRFGASWDAGPQDCPVPFVEALNRDDTAGFVIGTDDFELAAAPFDCLLDENRERFRFGVTESLWIDLTMDGVTRRREIRMTKESRVLYLSPEADTHVSAVEPDRSDFGDDRDLLVESQSLASFLRFQVPPLNGAVRSAALALTATQSVRRPNVFHLPLAGTWSETGSDPAAPALSWDNQASILRSEEAGGKDRLLPLNDGDWGPAGEEWPTLRRRRVDVARVLAGSGSYDFALESEAGAPFGAVGSEQQPATAAPQRPRLIITLDGEVLVPPQAAADELIVPARAVSFFISGDLLLANDDAVEMCGFDHSPPHPTRGQLVPFGMNATYLPDAEFFEMGSDQFTYRVSRTTDCALPHATATVTLIATPEAAADTFHIARNAERFFIMNGDLLDNDLATSVCSADGSTLQHGTLEPRANGFLFQPALSFSTAEVDTFTYTVSNQSDCSPPTATASVSLRPVDVDSCFQWSCSDAALTCNFDASCSTPQRDLTYQWDFGDPPGDGFTVPSESSTADHVYEEACTYPVTLRVSTLSLPKTTSERTIAVVVGEDLPPVPSFSYVCNGSVCEFDASASNDRCGIESFSWNLGDGNVSSGVATSHTYATDSSATVLLTVTDNAGQPVSISKTLLQAQFTASCSDFECSFSAIGNEGLSHSWSFGDGTVATGPAVTHTFSEEKVFTVSLTVADANGNRDKVYRELDVVDVTSLLLLFLDR